MNTIIYDKKTGKVLFRSSETSQGYIDFLEATGKGVILSDTPLSKSVRVVDGALVDDDTGKVSQLVLEKKESLENTDWLVTRHRDQQDLKVPTALTDEQYIGLLAYRQRLRDWTPDSGVTLPERPGFL